MDRGAWRAASPLGRKESDTTEQLTFALFFMYIYIFQIIFHYRLLQDIEYINNSLGYIVNPYCLSILGVVVSIC